MNRYSEYEALVAPARARSELWQLVLGVCATLIGYVALVYAALSIVLTVPSLLKSFQSTGTPTGMMFTLFSFGFLTLALLVALRLVHHRGLPTLLGDARQCLHQFRATLKALLLLSVVVWLIPSVEGMDLFPNLEMSRWLLLLPLSLFGVLIQSGTEELVFRGYLQSQLAARFRSPLIWILVPSILFGALHYEPDFYGPNAIYVVISTTCFGIAAADLTARSGTLGPALALHFVNNLTALLLFGMQGDLSGLALYVLPFGPADTDFIRDALLIDAAILLCSWLAARLALRR